MRTTAFGWIRDRQRAGEISPKSARLYEAAIRSFTSYTGPVTPERITETAIRDWLASIDTLAPASRAKYLQVIRAFFQWCLEDGRIRKNPASRIRGPRIPDRLPVTLTPDQVRRLLRQVTSPRDRLVIVLAAQMGLRSIEIARLTTSDLSAAGDVRVWGKGDKERQVPISPDARRLWTEVRAQDPRPGALIRHSQTSEVRGLAAASIQAIVSKAMLGAGIKTGALDGLGIHALRRTFATAAIADGAEVFDVMELMGHAQLSSFRRYARPPKDRLAQITAARSYQQAS